MTDKKFARDVAVQLDKVTTRRRRVRRLLLLLLLAAAIALAITYLTCGSGFGFGGGKGKGEGEGEGPGSGSVKALIAPDAPPARCTVRVAAAGITVDGAQATKDQAVATCKARPGADITVTGGANQGTFDELRAAFFEAKIVFTIIDASSGGRGSGSASPAPGSDSPAPGSNTGSSAGSDSGSGSSAPLGSGS